MKQWQYLTYSYTINYKLNEKPLKSNKHFQILNSNSNNNNNNKITNTKNWNNNNMRQIKTLYNIKSYMQKNIYT